MVLRPVYEELVGSPIRSMNLPLLVNGFER